MGIDYDKKRVSTDTGEIENHETLYAPGDTTETEAIMSPQYYRDSILFLVPGGTYFHLEPLHAGTYGKVKTETYPRIASVRQNSGHKITT